MTTPRLTMINWLILTAGLVFLYAPMTILVIYSFNASRLVTVWAGFSLSWYAALLNDRALIEAVILSLEVATASATLATLIAVPAAFVLDRRRTGVARAAIAGTFAVPLVMPEIILGLSLLLLFVSTDMPRGVGTIILAHASLGSAFATIVIRASLAGLDRRLEEAASDLGCPPVSVFLRVTLPLIAPGMAAAWLLVFTLSLDDLVIASFTGGPGATTLPMRIYSAVRLGVSPQINAVSTLMIVAVSLALLFSARLMGALGNSGASIPR